MGGVASGEAGVGHKVTAAALGAMGLAAFHNWRAWRRGIRRAGSPAPSREAGDDLPSHVKVSVLVAAWEESASIGEHIRGFVRLGHPARQLVLCAGGSDGTYELASAMADTNVIVLEQHAGEGKQHALQRCLEVADGEIIMLTDADCLYSEGAFRRLIRPLVDGTSDVATGYRVPLQEQRTNPIARLQWFSESADGRVQHHVSGLWGGNCAITRQAILRAGAFLEPAATGTDYVQARLLLNAGYRIDWISDSRVETRYPGDVGSYVRVWRRWIKNIMIHGPRLGDWRGTSETVLAVAMAAVVLGSPLLAPVLGRVAFVVPMTALSMATMNRIRRVAIGAAVTGSRSTALDYIITPAVAVLDQWSTLLAAYDTLSVERRRCW